MIIHMTEIRDVRKYYDGIYSIYARRAKLSKDPTAKIPSATGKAVARLVIALLWLGLAVFANLVRAVRDTNYILTWVMTGLVGSIVILSAVQLIAFTRRVRTAKKTPSDAYLTVDENGVTLDNRVSQQITALLWADVQCIIVTKNIVCFLTYFQKNAPNKMSLCCDITYKDEILAAVEQCGYGHLIVVKKK